MNFKATRAADHSWEILENGCIQVNGVLLNYRKNLGDIHTALTEALAEYDRQIEANKPKPGEFEYGDIVRITHNPGRHFRVVNLIEFHDFNTVYIMDLDCDSVVYPYPRTNLVKVSE